MAPVSLLICFLCRQIANMICLYFFSERWLSGFLFPLSEYLFYKSMQGSFPMTHAGFGWATKVFWGPDEAFLVPKSLLSRHSIKCYDLAELAHTFCFGLAGMSHWIYHSHFHSGGCFQPLLSQASWTAWERILFFSIQKRKLKKVFIAFM